MPPDSRCRRKVLALKNSTQGELETVAENGTENGTQAQQADLAGVLKTNLEKAVAIRELIKPREYKSARAFRELRTGLDSGDENAMIRSIKDSEPELDGKDRGGLHN